MNVVDRSEFNSRNSKFTIVKKFSIPPWAKKFLGVIEKI